MYLLRLLYLYGLTLFFIAGCTFDSKDVASTSKQGQARGLITGFGLSSISPNANRSRTRIFVKVNYE